jgi:surface protein
MMPGFRWNKRGRAHTQRHLYSRRLQVSVNALLGRSTTSSVGCVLSESQNAVDVYLVDNSTGSDVASNYGHPIGNWCVSNIEDFSYLFNADNLFVPDGARLNLAAADFNEDISRWDVSNATTMRRMLASNPNFRHRFNQSIADWNVSSVTDMRAMFSDAL